MCLQAAYILNAVKTLDKAFFCLEAPSCKPCVLSSLLGWETPFFLLLSATQKSLPNFPLVLHCRSSLVKADSPLPTWFSQGSGWAGSAKRREKVERPGRLSCLHSCSPSSISVGFLGHASILSLVSSRVSCSTISSRWKVSLQLSAGPRIGALLSFLCTNSFGG